MKSFSSVDSCGTPFDYKLDAIIQKTDGFFIELGANDGLEQSNTAYFEFYRGWKGILIEPSLEKYKQCCTNRPNSIVKNYACVSNDYNDETIAGDFTGGLMSSVNGVRISSARSTPVVYSQLVKVNAITL